MFTLQATILADQALSKVMALAQQQAQHIVAIDDGEMIPAPTPMESLRECPNPECGGLGPNVICPLCGEWTLAPGKK